MVFIHYGGSARAECTHNGDAWDRQNLYVSADRCECLHSRAVAQATASVCQVMLWHQRNWSRQWRDIIHVYKYDMYDRFL